MSRSTFRVLGQVQIPQPPSLDGLFWIDPERMGTVNDVINSAEATTMWLGAKTRTPYFAEERDAIKSAFDPNNHLSPGDAHAIDVGFMYGTLLGSDNDNPAELDSKARLPDSFVGDLAARVAAVDEDRHEYVNYHLFQQLRDLEVEYAGSDVVAYGLAAAQDHLGHILAQHDKGDEDAPNRLRLQNLVYAGVLSGALSVTDKTLPFPEVEILRSLRPQGEVVALRAEFEPWDSIAQSVHGELVARQTFVPVKVGRDRHYAAVDGNVQFGPNILSIPLFTPDYYNLTRDEIIPAKQIDAVVVRTVQPQEEKPSINTFRIVEGSPALEDLQFEGINSISGLVHSEGYVSGLHPRHPWDAQIIDLIRHLGPGVSAMNGRVPFSEVSKPGSSARLKYILGAMTLGVFAKDVYGYMMLPNYEMNAYEAVTALGAVGVIALLAKCLDRSHQRHRRELASIDSSFQAALDEMILPD